MKRFQSIDHSLLAWAKRWLVEEYGPPDKNEIVIRVGIPTYWTLFKTFASLFLLALAFGGWLVNLLLHREWIPMLDQIFSWFLSPRLNTGYIAFARWPMALLAWGGIFAVGTLSVYRFLPLEDGLWLKRFTAVVFGLGWVGTTVVWLAVFSRLSFLNLGLALVLLFVLLVWDWSEMSFSLAFQKVKNAFRIRHLSRRDFRTSTLLLAVINLVYLVMMQFHALSFPEFDWDATVYHATMAKLMFRFGGIPLIAGPSIGLELSANYPPLFPALGAYFYTVIGTFDDVYLRMIPPFCAVLVSYATFKLGVLVGGNLHGSIATLLLELTPLFFYRSLSATNYMLVITFLNYSLLFLILAYQKSNSHYWIVSGLAYGFALLTSYHALFFLPSMVLIVGFMLWENSVEQRHEVLRGAMVVVLASLTIGGVWFARNMVVVGNPIYPFGYSLFGGKYLDLEMLRRTISGVRRDSLIAFWGTDSVSVREYLLGIFGNSVHFPALSVIFLAGVALLVFLKKRRLWTIIILYTIFPFVVIFSTVANIFPRYILLFLPQLALISASVFAVGLRVIADIPITVGRDARVTRLSFPFRSLAYSAVGVFFALTLIFPGLFAIVGGKGFDEADWNKPPENLLRFVEPLQNASDNVLEMAYGNEVKAWDWISASLRNDARVATYENRVYYIADSRPAAFFYLDGWEARRLYDISAPDDMLKILRAENVQYILDPLWIHHWEMYDALPLNDFLGWPGYFPLVFSTPSAKVYQVGKIYDPVTRHSPIPVSLSPDGWSDIRFLAGRVVRQVSQGEERARLYIGITSPVILRITYLDRGEGEVVFNLLTADGEWNYDFRKIELRDTGEWLTAVFVLATEDTAGLTELGVYAAGNNFDVTKIEVHRLK